MSVTYMIPGNDDTKTAMKYYCDLMEKAVIEGKYCRANLINLVDVGATPESPGVLAGGLASA
jgi:ribosomal protein S2